MIHCRHTSGLPRALNAIRADQPTHAPRRTSARRGAAGLRSATRCAVPFPVSRSLPSRADGHARRTPAAESEAVGRLRRPAACQAPHRLGLCGETAAASRRGARSNGVVVDAVVAGVIRSGTIDDVEPAAVRSTADDVRVGPARSCLPSGLFIVRSTNQNECDVICFDHRSWSTVEPRVGPCPRGESRSSVSWPRTLAVAGRPAGRRLVGLVVRSNRIDVACRDRDAAAADTLGWSTGDDHAEVPIVMTDTNPMPGARVADRSHGQALEQLGAATAPHSTSSDERHQLESAVAPEIRAAPVLSHQ